MAMRVVSHALTPPTAVMLRACGASSTPRLLGSITYCALAYLPS